MASIDRLRRAVVGAALLGTGVAGFLSPAESFLDRFAPLSGSVWRSARDERPSEVESPYGNADVAYDDYGVPHVSASNERALYFAVGFVQATDRLFQLDLLRRVMRGELSAVVGEATLDSDRFHTAMDFVGAADATWANVESTVVGPLVSAFADGVNASLETGSLPVEFSLLEYEPAPWTPVDTMLMEKQISWGLTGSFEPLRRATLRETYDSAVVEDLLPTEMDHDYPILRNETGGETTGSAAEPADYRGLLDWLGTYEREPGIGSNSWIVSGEYTESGAPILANDPHLELRAPPVWYQQHLEAPSYRVRGVTFPGVPFVIIGENEAGAWGFTNVGADVVDHYTYETDGEQYRYGAEYRDFELSERTIEVADGQDRTVEVRKTVHGPVVSREGMEVGVAWTGFSATETTLAVYRMGKSDGLESFREAARRFDLPTQNVVYADRDGNTFYHVTGRIPIRRIDGDPVSGNRIFDGSAKAGDWEGYTPYGTSSWDGFIPFEEKPGVVNPEYVATANQRVTDDSTYYIGVEYAPPFRGKRIEDRLSRAIRDGPVTAATFRDIQRDTYDERAAMLIPRLESVRGELSSEATNLLESLLEWDRRMDPDSKGALIFDVFVEAYRELLFEEAIEAAGLDESAWPNDWVAITVDPDSPFFDLTDSPETKAAALAGALERTVERLDASEWSVYGDRNVVAIDHPFDQSFLNYTRMPTGGSRATVNNFRADSAAGSSWRMVSSMDGSSSVVLPGGNSGRPFGEHYEDQLRDWAAGRYLPFSRETGDGDIVFRGEDS